MPQRNLYPEEENLGPNKEEDGGASTPKVGLLKQLFGLGGIPLPEGNKLAIWFLVVVVLMFIIFFYFFMNIMDKVVDKALSSEVNKEEILQEDYNKLLKDAKILKAENERLKSMDTVSNSSEIDSILYEKTSSYINK